MRKIDLFQATLSIAKAFALNYKPTRSTMTDKEDCYRYCLRQLISSEELREFERQLRSQSNSLSPEERAIKFVKELFKVTTISV